MVRAAALVSYAFVLVLARAIVGGLHRPPRDARAPQRLHVMLEILLTV